jgi:hypothetical protein
MDAWKYTTSGPPAESSLQSVLNASWTLDEIVVSDNTGNTDNYYVLPVKLAGTYPSDNLPLPPNVAAAVSWDIDKKYKGGHPRTYLPGIDSQALAASGSNIWSAAFIAALKAAALVFLQQVVAYLIGAGMASATPGVISRYSKGPRPSAVFFPITNSSSDVPVVNERVDTQRRRLGKEVTAR